jgi:hypothetical protein
MDKELKEHLASLNFKPDRFGNMEGSHNGYRFTVIDTPFNIVIIYYFISTRVIREPQEVKLPKNADIKMIYKCILGIAKVPVEQSEDALEIYQLYKDGDLEEISKNLFNRGYKKFPQIYTL